MDFMPFCQQNGKFSRTPIYGQEPDGEDVTSSLCLERSARSADTTSINQNQGGSLFPVLHHKSTHNVMRWFLFQGRILLAVWTIGG